MIHHPPWGSYKQEKRKIMIAQKTCTRMALTFMLWSMLGTNTSQFQSYSLLKKFEGHDKVRAHPRWVCSKGALNGGA